jgi:hypothetical protein
MARMGIFDPSPPPNPNHYAVKRGGSHFEMRPWIYHYLEKHPDLYSAG